MADLVKEVKTIVPEKAKVRVIWEDLPEKEEIEFVNYVSNNFNGIINGLYKDFRK